MSYFLPPLDHLLAETICGHLNVVDISGQKGIDGSVKTCINCALSDVSDVSWVFSKVFCKRVG